MRHMTSLNYIDAVARAGSIRGAADLLSITASALNRRILAIEDELGVELFERHSNGMTLNSAGELFVFHIRNQIADLERVRSQIADLQGNRRGHIRIVAEPGLMPHFLAEEVAHYLAKFPKVTFEIRGLERVSAEAALLNQETDLALVMDSGRSQDIDPLVYHPQPVLAVMASHQAPGRSDGITLSECMQHPMLVPPRRTALRETLEAGLSRAGLQLTPCVESDDAMMLVNMARQGIGIAFATDLTLPERGTLAQVTTLPVRLRDQSAPLMIVAQRRGRSLPVAVAKFVEELRGRLAMRVAAAAL